MQEDDIGGGKRQSGGEQNGGEDLHYCTSKSIHCVAVRYFSLASLSVTVTWST
jgi:hypothetical protein